MLRKTEEEIGRIREAGRVNALAHREVRNLLRPGITTRELDEAVGRVLAEHEAIPSFRYSYGFPAHMSVAVNEEVGHGIPGNRVIRAGDVVKIDIGVEYAGYHSDCAMTYLVGGAGTSDARKLIEATRQALYRGIGRALPGNRISDISHAIQTTVRAYGMNVIRHAFGHGIGKRLHEEPQIANFGPPGYGQRLKAGMVLAVEPVVTNGSGYTRTRGDGWTSETVDGSYSAHFEHTVLVAEQGPEILTALPDDRATPVPDGIRSCGEQAFAAETFRFRPKTDTDQEILLRLAQKNMNPILIEAWGRPVDPEILNEKGSTAIVVEAENGEVAGFYTFSKRKRSLFLNTIVIDTAFQGKGLGKQVMGRLFQTARDKGLSAVELCVQTNNRHAMRFYQKLGFRIFDRPYLNTVAMRKLL